MQATAVSAFSTGLARPERIERFARDAQAVALRWRDLLNREEQLASLRDLIINLANSVGFPSPSLELDHYGERSRRYQSTGLAAHENAVFSRQRWSIVVKASRLNEAFAFNADKARFAGTLYHEARHAEQSFRVARLIAGKILANFSDTASAAAIPVLQERVGVPEPVAYAALANPLLEPHAQSAGEERCFWDEALRWADDLWAEWDRRSAASRAGRELADRQARYTAVGESFALSFRHYVVSDAIDPVAAKAHVAENWQSFLRSEEQLAQAFEGYASLAVEQDAWRVGGEVEKQLNPDGPLHSMADELNKLRAVRLDIESNCDRIAAVRLAESTEKPSR